MRPYAKMTSVWVTCIKCMPTADTFALDFRSRLSHDSPREFSFSTMSFSALTNPHTSPSSLARWSAFLGALPPPRCSSQLSIQRLLQLACTGSLCYRFIIHVSFELVTLGGCSCRLANVDGLSRTPPTSGIPPQAQRDEGIATIRFTHGIYTWSIVQYGLRSSRGARAKI